MSLDRMTGQGGSRDIVARWVVCGDLVLDSACSLSNGERGDRVDMPLLRDRLDGCPLLLGTSLAGSLRSHVCDRLSGYRAVEDALVSRLFGAQRGNDDGSQSPLIVFDSRSAQSNTEIRDGVTIHAANGTAADHLKFDREVLPAGTVFPLRLELVIADAEREAEELSLLAAALLGLQRGEIPIGGRRSRGFGACHVATWRVKRFDLSSRVGWSMWLASSHLEPLQDIDPSNDIVSALQAPDSATAHSLADQRRQIRIELNLQFQGGLLIRSPGLHADSADVGHLHSGNVPILSGTSLAGVMRARAARIARLVRQKQGDADLWIERLFGPRKPEDGQSFQPSDSRLRVSERHVEDAHSLQVARIRVDRFTSGVVDGGLFDEEPAYRGRSEVTLTLHNPESGELGLLLLVVKDLLTADLPVGGSGAVGRGVVRGRAEVHLPGREQSVLLDPEQKADAETIALLNEQVRQFHEAHHAPEGT